MENVIVVKPSAMLFFVPTIWQNDTHTGTTVPVIYHPYLLEGSMATFTSGPWGCFISQFIQRANYNLWVHNFFIEKDITIYPYSGIDLLSLHMLLRGRLQCVLKGTEDVPVLLDTNISNLFHVPGRVRHEAYFKAGMKVMSLQIDFKNDFLEKAAAHHILLQELLHDAKTEPGRAHYQMGTALNAKDIILLEAIPGELKKTGGPELYLDGKVEELLRSYLQKQQFYDRQQLLQKANFHFAPKDLDGIIRIMNIMEANLNKHYTTRDYIRMTGLNADMIKKGFKYVTGMPLSVYRKQLCMQHAKDRVLQKKYSIQQIAAECGFASVSHFISEYKKYWGTTPGNAKETEET